MTESFNSNNFNSLISSELQKLRDDVFIKINETIKNQQNFEEEIKYKFEFKNREFNDQFNSLNNKVKEIENISIKDKNKLDLIDSINEFKKKAEQDLVTQEIRVNGAYKDLKDVCYKYDKIYLENLFIPGIIGDQGCRFKNMKEFIDYNLTNLSSIINFKEKSSAELKYVKERVDNLPKFISTSISDSERGLKVYFKAMNESIEAICKSQINEISERIVDCKMENNKYSIELTKTTNELKNEREELITLKSEIYEKFEKFTLSQKDSGRKFKENLEKTNGEFREIKEKFNELANFITDIRFRGNLANGDYDKKELKSISKKLSFTNVKNSINKRKSLQSNINTNNAFKELINEDPKKADKKKFPTQIQEKMILETQEEHNNENQDLNKSKGSSFEFNYEKEENDKFFRRGSEDIMNLLSKNKDVTESTTPIILHSASPQIKIDYLNHSQNIRFINTNEMKLNSNEFDLKNRNSLKNEIFAVPSTEDELKKNDDETSNPNKSVFSSSLKTTKTTKINLQEKEKSTKSLPYKVMKNQAKEKDISSDYQKNKTINFQEFYDKINDLKKEYFVKYQQNEKKIQEMENSYKNRFDTLIKHLQTHFQINFNEIIKEAEPVTIDSNKSKNNSNKEVPNPNIAVNILDPKEIFKNSELEYEKKNRVIKNQAIGEIPYFKVKKLMQYNDGIRYVNNEKSKDEYAYSRKAEASNDSKRSKSYFSSYIQKK